MSQIAIRVENLGKQYRIGSLQRSGARHTYKSLRDSIANAVALPLRAFRSVARKNGHVQSTSEENFSALSDVSFEVKRGEVVGVIGRNGAGKSTLLKILSRITQPTSGRVEIHGRVGSLLEVGTGFHPELTGRDNIYLNGAILGMKRSEITRQFDEIVAFAEVEKFIDTPVKHYSSGMYLRLAFAVAAHLEPEILLVDEVLAVGDYRFQEKCLGKMGAIAGTGRTVLFVSHNMSAVGRLCRRAVVLERGKLGHQGDVQSAIRRYLTRGETADISFSPSANCGPQNRYGVQLLSATVEDTRAERRAEFGTSESVCIVLEVELGTPSSDLSIGFDLRSQRDGVVFRSCHNDADPRNWPQLRAGRNTLTARIPAGLLNSDDYWLSVHISLHCREWLVQLEDILSFHTTVDHSTSPFWNAAERLKPGCIAPVLQWAIQDEHETTRKPDRS